MEGAHVGGGGAVPPIPESVRHSEENMGFGGGASGGAGDGTRGAGGGSSLPCAAALR